MRCESSTENLSAYLDGELDSQQAQRLREHLATCSECRRQAGALSQTATLVRAMPEVDPPADLRQRASRLMAATIGNVDVSWKRLSVQRNELMFRCFSEVRKKLWE